MTTRLEWTKLLADTRIRSLLGGHDSVRLPNDFRTEFERDYKRTVFSTSFRRLRDKAQVFPLEPHDAVRTRLSHSLEVSAIAEGLAAQVVREVLGRFEKLPESILRSIPLVAATCGLVHDLGNPPFGHAGELAITTWFGEKGTEALRSVGKGTDQKVCDFTRFEGNAQAIRILSNVFLFTDAYGLNLTAATMSAACKYLAGSHEAAPDEREHERQKPGYFWSESAVIDRIREATGTRNVRHPITFLVEAADDIVYCSVDLEDSVKKSALSWSYISGRLRTLCDDSKIFQDVLKRLEKLVGPSIRDEKESAEIMALAFRTALISAASTAVVDIFRERYEAIMTGQYHGELVYDPLCSAKPLVEACRTILRESVYRSRQVLSLEVRGRSVIHDLMNLFWEGIAAYPENQTPRTYEGKLYLLISDNYRRTFEESVRREPSEHIYWKLRLLTDQVSGMTDTYACRLHSELTNGQDRR